MSTDQLTIFVIVVVGVLTLAVGAAAIARAIRLTRLRDALWAEVARADGLGITREARPGLTGLHPVLRGVVGQVRLETREARRGSSGQHSTVTRFRAWIAPAPPPFVVAYRSSVRHLVGGSDEIMDDPTERGLVGASRDDLIGDPELDAALAIQADAQGVVRALLTAPEVKRWVLHTVARAGHVRIEGETVFVDRVGVVTERAELDELVMCITGIARALGAATGQLERRSV